MPKSAPSSVKEQSKFERSSRPQRDRSGNTLARLHQAREAGIPDSSISSLLNANAARGGKSASNTPFSESDIEVLDRFYVAHETQVSLISQEQVVALNNLNQASLEEAEDTSEDYLGGMLPA
ncbi:hypothetical protein QPB21_004632 [Vibrio alginolyticus]|nr:hypothetical protein [Vibrio alginolyticus]